MPRRRKTPKPLRPTAIINRLVREAPLTPWRLTHDPVTELVLTLLSQNTSDTNSGRAFQQLVARYEDWDAVLNSDPDELEDTIRPGGLAPTKSARMRAAAHPTPRAPRPRLGRRHPQDHADPPSQAVADLTAWRGTQDRRLRAALLARATRPAR